MHIIYDEHFSKISSQGNILLIPFLHKLFGKGKNTNFLLWVFRIFQIMSNSHCISSPQESMLFNFLWICNFLGVGNHSTYWLSGVKTHWVCILLYLGVLVYTQAFLFLKFKFPILGNVIITEIWEDEHTHIHTYKDDSSISLETFCLTTITTTKIDDFQT